MVFFSEGRLEEARDRLLQIDVFKLPLSIAGQVAYIRALSLGHACSDRFGDDLKRVSLLAPGLLMSGKLATKTMKACPLHPDLQVRDLLFRQLVKTLGDEQYANTDRSLAYPEVDSLLFGILSESESARSLFGRLPYQVRSRAAQFIGRRALLSPSEARSRLLEFAVNAVSYDPKLQNVLRVYRFACCFMTAWDDDVVSDQIRMDELDSEHRAIVEAAKNLRRLVGSIESAPR